MQIGTISLTGRMRLLSSGLTGLSPFGFDRLSNNHRLGYSFLLFAEKIIKKYELVDNYGFQPAVLVFLYNLYEEAEKHEECRSRAEETLRLLILWNERNQVENQIACHQNVYLATLKNEIDINLAKVKELNVSYYNQLRQLYTNETSEQNLIVCQNLITELKSRATTTVGAASILRKNQTDHILNTVVNEDIITPFSLSYSFHTMLESIVNISYIPDNRALFYSSVRNQLIHHFLNKIEDINVFEDVIQYSADSSLMQNRHSVYNHLLVDHSYNIAHTPSIFSNAKNDKTFRNYNSLLVGARPFLRLGDRGQLLEYLQKVSEKEFEIISRQIVELLNSREYSSLNHLIEQLFVKEAGGGIPQLITGRRRLSDEVLSFLENKSFTKSELLRMIEKGTSHERVLVFNALNYAAENAANIHIVTGVNNTISTLSNLLHKAENNNFDVSQEYDLGETGLTINQFISRQEHSVWNEIEKQVNQYKSAVSRQLNNNNLLESLLSPTMTKNEIVSILNDTKDDSIFNTIRTAINHISAGGAGWVFSPEEFVQNLGDVSLNLRSFFLQSAEYQRIISPMLQYRITKIPDGISNSLAAAQKNDIVMNLMRRPGNYISPERQRSVPSLNEKYRHVYRDQNILLETTRAENNKDQTIVFTRLSEEIANKLLKTPSPVFKQGMTTKYYGVTEKYLHPKTEFNLSEMLDQTAYNATNINAAGDGNSNISLIKNTANMAVGIRNQARFMRKTGVQNLSRYLISLFRSDSYESNKVDPIPEINASEVRDQTFYNVTNVYTAGKKSFAILRNAANMAGAQIRILTMEKHRRFIIKTEPQNLYRFLTTHNSAKLRTLRSEQPESNNVDVNSRIEFSKRDQGQSEKPQNYVSPAQSQREIINRFGNLIYNPNSPPSELTVRQADNILTQAAPAELPGIPELINRIQVQSQETQNYTSLAQSQKEIIHRFANLIYNPNSPPSELTGRQADNILTQAAPVESTSIPELIKKIMLGEQIIREEQHKVTELSQKIKEHENVIYKLNHAHTQLQEDIASRISEKKIKLMVMKELQSKMRLEKMRHGLQ